MKAGRELDAKVAEEVMGWDWNSKSAGWMQKIEVDGLTETIDIIELPHYSTDIAAAWLVVEILLEDLEGGLEIDIHSFAGDWHVNMTGRGKIGRGVESALPHAICLAALDAVKAR